MKKIINLLSAGIIIGFILGVVIPYNCVIQNRYFQYKMFRLISFSLQESLNKQTASIVFAILVLVIVFAIAKLIWNLFLSSVIEVRIKDKRKLSVFIFCAAFFFGGGWAINHYFLPHKFHPVSLLGDVGILLFTFLMGWVLNKVKLKVPSCFSINAKYIRGAALVIAIGLLLLNFGIFLYDKIILPKEPNVILIIFDALRKDHLGCYGHFRNTTPSIDALAQKSLVFENGYAAAPWTRPSIASIVSSKLPIEHGIYSEGSNEYLDAGFLTIQEFFNAKRYTTAAFYGNGHFNFGVVQNFDYTHHKGNEWANQTYAKVLDWLKKNSRKKFFLLIHNNDPHDAYEYREGFSTTPEHSIYRELDPFFPGRKSEKTWADEKSVIRINKEQLAEMKANYDGEIAFLDHHFGRLLAYLKRSGLDKKTIIIIIADHGEEFLDHGRYGHGGTLYNELLRIPFIIHIPGMKHRVFRENVSTIDIFPTLVDIFDGGICDAYALTGQSLLPLIEDRQWEEKPIFAATAFRGPLQYSLIDGHHKIIKRADGKISGLYDLENDPNELNNLKDQEPETLKVMNGLLTELILRYKGEEFHSEVEYKVDPKILEELKSLGYLN